MSGAVTHVLDASAALCGILLEAGHAGVERVAERAALSRVDHAEVAARLRPAVRAAGLSLGDRRCLALARRRGAVGVTADRAWGRLDPALGIAVDLVR